MFTIEGLLPFTSVMLTMIISVCIFLIKEKALPKGYIIIVGILCALLILFGIVCPAYYMITGHDLLFAEPTKTYWNLTELGLEDGAVL